jgi:Flp pilus assembly protein TadG
MIARLFQNLRSLVGRFEREERGVAAVEFALIMPFLLALYFGSMEAAALFTADKRVNSISATIGDLVSQWDPDDGNLPASTMTDYLSASTGIMTPYATTGLKIVVSLIEVKSDGTTKVLWSKANAAGTARTVNTAYTPLITTSQMNQVSRGGCVVAAETTYSYKPLLGAVFTNALNLSHTNYFLPRFGATDPNSYDTTTQAANACTA